MIKCKCKLTDMAIGKSISWECPVCEKDGRWADPSLDEIRIDRNTLIDLNKIRVDLD